jgi:hypothetical protein
MGPQAQLEEAPAQQVFTRETSGTKQGVIDRENYAGAFLSDSHATAGCVKDDREIDC